jgi:hypothetical protein
MVAVTDVGLEHNHSLGINFAILDSNCKKQEIAYSTPQV